MEFEERIKIFTSKIKEKLKHIDTEEQGLLDTVLEIGWNYLQAHKSEGDSQ